VIERLGHVREQSRIAVAHRQYDCANLRVSGLRRDRGEAGPAFEVRTVPIAVERKEVIPIQDHVYAKIVGPQPGAPTVVERRVLWVELYTPFEHAHAAIFL